MSEPSNTAAVIQEAFNSAVQHHQAGRTEMAEELYRAILQLHPQHAEANHNLGLLAVQLQQPQLAQQYLNAAVSARPDEPRFWISYIEALAYFGNTKAALEVLALSQHQGLQLQAPIVTQLLQQTRATQDTAAATSDLPLPSSAEVQALNAALEKQDYARLEKLAQTIAEKYPHAQEGWKSLSLAYYHTQRFELALAPTQKLVELFPHEAQMHANLGLILWRLRRLDEAAAALIRACAMDPDASDTLTNLGSVRREQGRPEEAMQCYRQAITLDPQQAVAHSNLGVLLIDHQAFREAETCFRTALEINPNDTYALRNLATALTKLGHLEEAETTIRRAVPLDPDNTLAYDLLLFLLNYTHVDQSAEARELAVRYGQIVARKRHTRYTQWRCEAHPHRLRIGLVSADLHAHPVGYFVDSLVQQIDMQRFELYVYAHMPEAKYDAVTTRIQSRCAAWKSIYLHSDAAAADLIHADGINILLDLSGHTTDNRLPVFACKPAPVQASWLGYFATTGVAEMDYLIGDPYLCPKAETSDFTETPWPLPETWLCFTPPTEDIPVAALPALQNGYITFGCFNNLNKMNDAVVALWAQLLQRVPNARLLLKAPQLRDADVQAQTLSRFMAHGIAADRIQLEGPAPRSEYLRAFAKVDIALDPFPYPGGATSVDTLWMGVPVLTLRGNRFLAHLGESIALNAGLPEWIAADHDDYVIKAIALASDINGLSELRASLRERLRDTPLLDTNAFARGFEDTLQQMWVRYAPATPVRLQTLPPDEDKQLQRLLGQGKLGELEKRVAKAVRTYPQAPAVWRHAALAAYHRGNMSEALKAAQQMLALQPDLALAHATQGLALIGLGRLAEAAASLQQAIQLDPQQIDPYINIAYVQRHLGQLEAAVSSYRQALAINPKLVEAHANLGVVLLEQQALRAAESSFRNALALAPKHTAAMLGLAAVLSKLDLLEEAETLARRLIKLEPDQTTAYDILLFLLNYRNTGYSQEAFDLARRYGVLVSRKAGKPYRTWLCDTQPRKLRVGLVSGDLYNHPVGYFLEGLLGALDREQIEVFAYANRPDYRHDAMSERLRAHCTGWRSIQGMSDAAAAAMIHADGVHILIDLAGHTGNTRLSVFAYKPAPVQVAWLGYFATTGVAEIDYLLGDPNVCPPGEEQHFSERVWRLPETYLCFTPPDADLAVNALPAHNAGGITFGCFNNVGKLNESVIAVWSRILQQVPGSRLLLKARQLGDAAMCERLRERFSVHGIDNTQLHLEGPSSRHDYLKAYQRLDIVLDPFPYPGGTTTMEALWMSVPVLTLRGNRMLSHAGENIMRNVGLPEWIADDENAYVAKAVDFAGQLEMLAQLRAELRAKVLASPMFDAPRFARYFEGALQAMWQTHST